LVNINISYDKLQSLLLRILTREIFCQSSAEGLAGVSQCLHRSTDPQIHRSVRNITVPDLSVQLSQVEQLVGKLMCVNTARGTSSMAISTPSLSWRSWT
jgi:hypothetical protein